MQSRSFLYYKSNLYACQASYTSSAMNAIININMEVSAALESLEVARISVEGASEKHAIDILLLDIRDVSSLADYFVICSGESAPQLKSICDEIEKALEKAGVKPHHQEGKAGSGWVLLDYGDVVVHIFSVEEREKYQLDKLWSAARTVVRVQ